MSDRSKRFGFTVLDQPTDQLDLDDWKFGVADRILLDRILAYVVQHHRHTGTAGVITAPGAPTLVPSKTGGILPAGSTFYYKYALVDDKSQEAVASTMGVVHTPVQLHTPEPPNLDLISTGQLPPGLYTYAISAYTTDASQETPTSRPATTMGSNNCSIELLLPAPPSGADGFNIYRKGPTDLELYFLASVNTTMTTYTDDGNTRSNAHRVVPVSNSTFSSNSVRVGPAASVSIPSGYSWKVFRTTNPVDWSTTLVTWAAYTGTIVDTGHATRPGTPALTSAAVGGAPKIDLSDMAEVDGYLPPGHNVYPHQADFTIEGLLNTGSSRLMWVNEFDRAEVASVRASLGRGSAPAAQDVIVTLEVQRFGEDTWIETLDPSERATVPMGEEVGPLVPVNPASFYYPGSGNAVLAPGDSLRLNVLQVGEGATPTDSDLVLSVMLYVQHGSLTQTYTWETA